MGRGAEAHGEGGTESVIDWKSYCTWTHETAMRRSIAGTDDREKAELMEIWGLGLGGEFLEFLDEQVEEDGPWFSSREEITDRGMEEIGDCVYYLARLYVDTGNVLGDDPFERSTGFRDVVRSVKDVVETIKKALRKEGRSGLIRLTIGKGECSLTALQAGYPRREEFGILLDRAWWSINYMLGEMGNNFGEVMDANVAKLNKRRAEGTISISERGDAIGVAALTSKFPPGSGNEIIRQGILDGGCTKAQRIYLEMQASCGVNETLDEKQRAVNIARTATSPNTTGDPKRSG